MLGMESPGFCQADSMHEELKLHLSLGERYTYTLIHRATCLTRSTCRILIGNRESLTIQH